MKIYFYDKKTKEYLGAEEAYKDPAESKKQGKFIPLIPACAVLIKPPAVLDNQIQIFNTDKKEWDIVSDYRKNFCKIDKDLNVFDITETGGITSDYILVSKDTAEEIKKSKDKFKIINNKIVKKSDEEYAAEKFTEAKMAKYRENEEKSDYARYNQSFTVTIQDKECVFDTSSKTQTDLLTAFAVCSTGLTYDGWITNNGVELNLTIDDVYLISASFKELSNVYPKWNYFKNLIDESKTIDELNSIVIDYSL